MALQGGGDEEKAPGVGDKVSRIKQRVLNMHSSNSPDTGNFITSPHLDMRPTPHP